MEGEKDPMEVYAILQTIRKSIEPIEKSVKAQAIEKALEAGADKEPVRYFGFEFRYKNGARRADYKHLASWVDANKDLKKIEKLAKTAEEMGQPMVNPDTGEMVDPVRYTYNASSLSVSQV